MKRIIVSVTNDLVTDQRVYKTCKTLSNNGFDILLIGRKLDDNQPLNRNYSTFRFKLLFNKGFLFYAEFNIRLFLKLLFSKKDILFANDLDTLLPNYLISVLFNKKLVYDSHELFTEVPELINRPFQQKFWRSIEQFIIPKLKNCTTVSDSIAEYYFKTYGTTFTTIRNLPLKTDINTVSKLPFELQNKKSIIYQGAINVGRGLELMLETMQYLNNVVFIIIGKGDIEKEIHQNTADLNLSRSVYFIPRIHPEELKYITPNADLGISFEEELGLNYRYALPNKLFDYIQAKVPVLVSNLPEMSKIVVENKIGEVIIDRKPEILAKQIQTILFKGKSYYYKNLEIAGNQLIWEKESIKFLKHFD